MEKTENRAKKKQFGSIEDAGKKLYEAAVLLGVENLSVEESYGRVLAEDLIAKLTQPPFRRSAMDGYAVRYEDICAVTETEKVFLPVADAIYAGDSPLSGELQGAAVKIMTGAPVPDWADVVIPHEMTDRGEEQVRIDRALSKESNCVPAGEDFMEGDTLSERGSVVDPYTIATAVAGGITSVEVRSKVRVSVLTTGSELIDAGQPILPGQIYNSSKAFFAVRLKELGCEVLEASQVSDEPEAIAESLKALAEESDLIVTTGGVSVGEKDYLPLVLEQIGAETVFQGIAVKPGSPTMAAKYKDAIILCLSGNPFSAIAMFETLFPYYEYKAMGLKEMPMKVCKTICKNSYPKKSKMRRLIRGKLDPEGVTVPAQQRNGQLQAGIGCNCLVEIPAGSERVEAGEMVTVHYRSM